MMTAATGTPSIITRLGEAAFAIAAAATLTVAIPGGSATAVTSPAPASAHSPAARHQGFSACQGKLTGPEKAGTASINFSSWTECFGDVVWIHSYVELQIWGEDREGWEWVTIGGPHEKKYPGITGSKVFNNQWTPCVTSGKYRETGWSTWGNFAGEIGTTSHASKTANIEC